MELVDAKHNGTERHAQASMHERAAALLLQLRHDLVNLACARVWSREPCLSKPLQRSCPCRDQVLTLQRITDEPVVPENLHEDSRTDHVAGAGGNP